MKFGEAIRHLREHSGMTLRELARATGISVPYLHDVETGKRAPFADEKRERVYQALRLDESQGAEFEVLRVVALGYLDVSGMNEEDIRELVAARGELQRIAREKRS